MSEDPTHANPVPVNWVMGSQISKGETPQPSPPASPVQARALAALEQALREDPLFSPLAELSLARTRTLGQGGMGIVSLVQDQRLDRPAALKLLLNETPRSVTRFRREAVVTARLDHPGIPPVYEAGRTSQGQHYLLMRYVQGESMKEALDRIYPHRVDEDLEAPARDEEWRPLLGALVKVAEAVAYAHSRQVIHRDLKPANVMLGSFGEVLVMDWGLARNLEETASEDDAFRESIGAPVLAEDEASELTRAGSFLGTLGYMPAEQVQGQDVGSHSDVYALGAILVEVLTGRPPVTGDTALTVIGHTCQGMVDLPRDRDSSLPPALHAIAARALALEPASRYESARAFAQDLQAWLEERPVSVYHPGPLRQMARLVRRHPTPFAVVLVVFVASLVGAWLLAREREDASRAQRAEIADVAREQALKEVELLDGLPLLSIEGPEADRRREQRLAQALTALMAAERWHALDSAAASETLQRAAFELGRVARLSGQWPLARQAYAKAKGLGVDAEVERALDEIERDRTREANQREEEVRRLLAEAKAGHLERVRGGLQRAVLRLARYSEPRTVELVAASLDEVSEQLEKVERDMLLGAQDSAGKADLKAVLLKRAANERLSEAEAVLYQQAALRYARARGLQGHELGATYYAHLGAKQRDRLGPNPLTVARLCCEALGAIGIRDGAIEALGRYLASEGAELRALSAVDALWTLGGTRAREHLVRAERRFGAGTVFGQHLLALARHGPPFPGGFGPTDPPSDSGTAEDAFRQAEHQRVVKRWSRAEELYTIALRRDPNHYPARFNRGLVRSLRQDLSGAIEDYQAAKALQPGNAKVWLNLGLVLRRVNKLAEALRHMRKAVELEPKMAAAHLGLGRLQLRTNDNEAARASLETGLGLSPNHARPWGELGMACARLKRYPRAVVALTRSLELDDQRPEIWLLRAEVLLNQGRVQRALEDATAALELDEVNPTGHWLKGLALRRLDQLPAARQALERSVELKGPSAVRTDLVGVLFQLREFKAVLEMTRTALDSNPRDVIMLWRRAGALLLLERSKEAKQVMSALETVRGYPVRASLWLAALGGKPRFLAHIAKGPDSPQSLLARFHLGTLDQAALLRAFAKLSDRARVVFHTSVHAQLGLVAERRGDTAGARRSFEACLTSKVTGSLGYQLARLKLGR